jgi:hypothetical protein
LDGARYDPGATINFTVAAAASHNVARIELSLNGSIVATQANPQPTPTFSTRIAYAPPTQGRLQFQVVAVDGAIRLRYRWLSVRKRRRRPNRSHRVGTLRTASQDRMAARLPLHSFKM